MVVTILVFVFLKRKKVQYMQALASGAKNIVEFGTSYGISTLYLAAAARVNGGRVITCEYLPHKAAAARKHFQEAGLADYIELHEGDTLETLKDSDGIGSSFQLPYAYACNGRAYIQQHLDSSGIHFRDLHYEIGRASCRERV